MFEAIQLTKRFNGITVLDALNLKVEPGQVFRLLGPNGAGKTTSINLFLNFLTADGGEAKIDGLKVGAYPVETKRYLAYIPEQVNLYGNLSGVENLGYFSALPGRDYGRAELFGFLCAAGLSEVRRR